jgi:DNA-binding CsgD family transcriptional regulator
MTAHVGYGNYSTLSVAEERVFRLVGLGLSNREIAERLFNDQTTIRTHVKRIYAKTGIEGRARLAVESYKRYWATPNRFAAAIELIKSHGLAGASGEAVIILEQAGAQNV